MDYQRLHPWDVEYQEAVRIQESLRKRLILESGSLTIHRVAGADVSYSRKSKKVYAAVLVFSYPELELLESRFSYGEASFPYIPGLLSFREAPVLMAAFEKVTLTPDLVIFDGQGIAHPKRMGLASHCGILLQLPSIGCAKSRLIGEHKAVGQRKGTYRLLKVDGETLGAVVRTREKVKPIYVSPGHRIDLRTSISMILSLTRGYRLPEPTRQAHKAVNLSRQAAKH
jgi:deoxyribonuclease V